MLRRLWAFLTAPFRPERCERCGQPSAGFYAATSRTHGKAPDGTPVTLFRVRRLETLCRNCMVKAESETRGADDGDRG